MQLSINLIYQALPSATYYMVKNHTLRLLQNEDYFIGKDQDVGVAIDSRLTEHDDLFIALKGNKVDGHDFIEQALTRGASGVVVECLQAITSSLIPLLENKLIIIVENTYNALLHLARMWRSLFTMPVVAITGSVGKTTTKEMVRSILHAAGIQAFVSFKNQNTTIGLCLGILKTRLSDQAAVFEVGISVKGEMEQNVSLLRPTIALITWVAVSHAQGLGSLEDIAREKMKIFHYFTAQNIALINGDQPILAHKSYSYPTAKFGFKTSNQVQARKIHVAEQEGIFKTKFILKWYHERAEVLLSINHRGHVNNALAASAIAYFLHVPFNAVVKGLEQYTPFEHRFELRIMNEGKGKLISDCYNANPESMKAAIKSFESIRYAGKKVAVIGDMLELGEKEVFWHRQIGRFLAKTKTINAVILVGKRMQEASALLPARLAIKNASDWREALDLVQEELMQEPACVLVKASRGMQLFELVKVLTLHSTNE